jgi:hypothetical protein
VNESISGQDNRREDAKGVRQYLLYYLFNSLEEKILCQWRQPTEVQPTANLSARPASAMNEARYHETCTTGSMQLPRARFFKWPAS